MKKGKMRFDLFAAILVIILFLYVPVQPQPTAAQKVRVTSGKTQTVIYWEKSKGFTGYNLYRKPRGAGVYPGTPLNGGTAIAMVRSCSQFKTIIPEGSPEWKMMLNAFATLSKLSQTGSKSKTKTKSGPSSGSKFTPQAKATPIFPGSILDAVDPGQLKRIDPCTALGKGLTAEETALFHMLAAVNLKFRRAMGLAFIDSTATPKQRYTYQLRGVDRNGNETVLGA
ncbi:MAG: hypothetical protein GY940_32265, partial [bacterium]|nr:hypothetical protein [bacterium]